MKVLDINAEKLESEINRAYNKALPNASFRNGFKAGLLFANKEAVGSSSPAPKPPIGLMPKKIHDDFVKEKRAKEILQAISRYQENGFEAKKEWFIELCELNRCLYGSK